MTISYRRGWIGGLVVGVLVLLAVGGWFAWQARGDAGARSAAAPASAASGGGGPPVSVSTVAVARRNVDVILEATGTVAAQNSVDVRPQVASTIRQVHVREGQFVKAGQLLFTLDARNDEVAVTRAKAQLAKDQATLADAERQLARSRELLQQNFISQGAVDTNLTLVDAQRAVVASSKAAVEAAQVGLSYTRIAAPLAGRAGAINVYAGSLVQPGGNALVTITQLDPIGVSFALPQRHLAAALRTLRAGGGEVKAQLPDTRQPRSGKLVFVDNSVDAASGTVRVKAQFDNADERLWPGAFVTVRLAVDTLEGASVLPQAAIIQSPRGRIVYVVGAQNRVEARPVEIVYAEGEQAAVTGVKPGERIVLDGRQNLRPGAAVVERAPAPQTAPAGGGRRGNGASAPTGASSPQPSA